MTHHTPVRQTVQHTTHSQTISIYCVQHNGPQLCSWPLCSRLPQNERKGNERKGRENKHVQWCDIPVTETETNTEMIAFSIFFSSDHQTPLESISHPHGKINEIHWKQEMQISFSALQCAQPWLLRSSQSWKWEKKKCPIFLQQNTTPLILRSKVSK